ncbi:hypothetical protein OsI_38655 [Oryza sativa Indica Group]|uniref:Uncharacterized protein n=1 Tax=Oryza sativa subsp. indica TaxID=39946 RepID=A2ZLF9_ORYSI|nr:hypothetical protein OsI_38655 [Oryza sativa Indica Group]
MAHKTMALLSEYIEDGHCDGNELDKLQHEPDEVQQRLGAGDQLGRGLRDKFRACKLLDGYGPSDCPM